MQLLCFFSQSKPGQVFVNYTQEAVDPQRSHSNLDYDEPTEKINQEVQRTINRRKYSWFNVVWLRFNVVHKQSFV